MPQTYFLAFPGTECGRGLQLLEMQLPGEEQPVSTSRNHLVVFTRVPRKTNIGNIHYELNPSFRTPHIDLSVSWLSRNFSAEDFPIDVTMNGSASIHQLSAAKRPMR